MGQFGLLLIDAIESESRLTYMRVHNALLFESPTSPSPPARGRRTRSAKPSERATCVIIKIVVIPTVLKIFGLIVKSCVETRKSVAT